MIEMLERRDLQTRGKIFDMEICLSVSGIAFPAAPYISQHTIAEETC
jgi:hypothetical protein